jgi:hypothetical protein
MIPLDPMVYVARVHRGEDGKTKTLEIFYESDMIHLEQGDEFVTITTRVLLENPREEP